ncbi:HPr kinase/phosphorylase [Sulfitobacter mediterraneus]|uniref:Hpr(Ser) kinase/phosphatase n=1 Tax=Sulfitobacter mediterraneus TaxID=83219 RepID=A0A2T6CIN4_9RHOB|nr:HPr kinase/phosphatase C-terminal domain-containing protein [Sulfitobacter mediterraneus]PTX75368.1 Hpr(Ser) kinase/phosphatase [Sulfitobacter mediterraneus]
MAPLTETLHATSVSVEGHAVLILGASGTGKSALALQLIALGAELVADDRTIITRSSKTLRASVPEAIAGQIEARGVGILGVPHAASAQVVLAVDMGRQSAKRLPEPETIDVLGIALPCLCRVDGPHFAAAILLSLRRSINLRS